MPGPDVRRNSFGLSEWSGALGDLGVLLPLCFALALGNGIPVERMLLLWGLVYIGTGAFFRLPVAVQPLKAMAVIALAHGFSAAQLSGAATLYGLLFVALALSGGLRLLARFFTPALIRGVQLGIALMLAWKALELALGQGLYLAETQAAPQTNLLLILLLIPLFGYLQFRKNLPLLPLLLALGIAAVLAFGTVAVPPGGAALLLPALPDWAFLPDALVLLILPQIPLTLGNAVFAASDTCHSLWPARAGRVNPTALGFSIGLHNIAIGLLGGFPVCHGAGGIAAHARFGAQSGGATIILGALLVCAALALPVAGLLFAVPIALLAAMLLFDAGRMARLAFGLHGRDDVAVTCLIGGLACATRNLAVALAAGYALQKFLAYYRRRAAQAAAPVDMPQSVTRVSQPQQEQTQ